MTPWLDDGDVRLFHGDALETLRSLPGASVDMVATSPPFYGLRDYGVDGQIGLEASPDEWVSRLVDVFRECRRVLADHGTLWVEIGDSYNAGTSGRQPHPTGTSDHGGWSRAGEMGDRRIDASGFCKTKDLLGQPWALAFALRADGWYLRSEIIWSRPNPMPESVRDRPTKAHSTVFLLSKRPRYFYDQDAIRTPYAYDGRNVTTVEGRDGSLQHRNGERWPGIGKAQAQAQARRDVGEGGHDESEPMEITHAGANARSVWTIPTEPTPFAHFATWPQALVRRMILAGCPERVCRVCGNAHQRVIGTPTGNGGGPDPTVHTGRRGLNRPRGDNEGVRPITEAEQRAYAQQLKDSPARPQMEAEAGPAFAHYVRTDATGARPVPPSLLDSWIARGWLSPVAITDCGHGDWRQGIVLDPFAGSGTTLLVARNHGRHAVGIELNRDYCALAADRLKQLSLLAEAR